MTERAGLVIFKSFRFLVLYFLSCFHKYLVALFFSGLIHRMNQFSSSIIIYFIIFFKIL